MIENMVRILNELLAADPKAANEFFNLGVDVNKQVCDHPTIQVGTDRTRMGSDLAGCIQIRDPYPCIVPMNKPDSAQTGGVRILRPLGLLNGLLEGDRIIGMIMNASVTKITGFTVVTLTDGDVGTPDGGVAPVTAEIRDGQVFIAAGEKYQELLWNIQDEHKQKLVDAINAAFSKIDRRPEIPPWSVRHNCTDKKREQPMKLPKPISDYSDANPLIPPVQMVRFQDGRNAGLEEAAALAEGTESELAKKIRSLLFLAKR